MPEKKNKVILLEANFPEIDYLKQHLPLPKSYEFKTLVGLNDDERRKLIFQCDLFLELSGNTVLFITVLTSGRPVIGIALPELLRFVETYKQKNPGAVIELIKESHGASFETNLIRTITNILGDK